MDRWPLAVFIAALWPIALPLLAVHAANRFQGYRSELKAKRKRDSVSYGQTWTLKAYRVSWEDSYMDALHEVGMLVAPIAYLGVLAAINALLG